MRVAIFEPEPRVCGPMSWAYHLRNGIRANGHECDVVTFTRSGKMRAAWGEGNMRPGIRWWHKEPDVIGKMRDAARVLDGYDRVILTDVRTVMQDKEAAKGKGYLDPWTPDYLSILRDTNTPFTFALHGNNYPPGEVPFAQHLIALEHFVGGAVTHSPTSPNLSRHLWPSVHWRESPLPYEMVTSVDEDALAGASIGQDVVGITGRYISTKGHHALAIACGAGYMPSVAAVELWGASSLSLAASATYKTFEGLCLGKPWSLPGQRFGVIKPGERTETGGDVIRPYKWRVETIDHAQIISYEGGYESGYETCARLNVHVDLTASEFSDGMEYSQFEAIDAGCMQVSVRSMWSDDFLGEAITSVPSWPGESKLAGREEWQLTLREIGEAVERCVSLNEVARRRVVKHNRAVLASKHSPTVVARAFLETLGVQSKENT